MKATDQMDDVLFTMLTEQVPDAVVNELMSLVQQVVGPRISNRKAAQIAIGKVFIDAVKSAHSYQNRHNEEEVA